MTPQQYIELLKVLWKLGGIREYTTLNGEIITVNRSGEYDNMSEYFTGAEIIFDGTVYRGDVVISAGEITPSINNENVILQVVPFQSKYILKHDGSTIPQIQVNMDPVCVAAYENLYDGAGKCKCSSNISSMESHERVAMLTRLLAERLNNKCNVIKSIYSECDQNWNETMYIMLMRTMGGARNKEAFTNLARKVKYTVVSRERNTIQYVESLLLGTSGLLEMYEDDIYIRDLKSDYNYLMRKYSLSPMMPLEWDLSFNNPYNHPVVRIAQLAAFLSTKEFLFDNILRCRTVEDLQLLFRSEASLYWSTHYVPGRTTYETPKRIGHAKANLLGINLAVPMMFAYGDYIGDENLKESAIDLLEKITAESNRIVNGWRDKGVVMESAFDSQAILQLHNEYCLKKLCWQCPVGKRVIKKVFRESVTS